MMMALLGFVFFLWREQVELVGACGVSRAGGLFSHSSALCVNSGSDGEQSQGKDGKPLVQHQVAACMCGEWQ